MSIPFEGFTGPSYALQNRYAAVERCVNWFSVVNESQEEKKWKLALEPSPGNAAFSALPVPAPFNQPCRALLELRGITYGVNGDCVFSISGDGVYYQIGRVFNDGKPVSMVANGTGQIFIASGGNGYVIPRGGSIGSLIPLGRGSFLGSSYATFQDGYIVVVTPDSNQFQISGTDDVPIGDATLWDAANVSIQAGQADNLVACISSREYLRILGTRRSQVLADVGSGGIGAFPFQSYNETFIETGIAAAYSLADLGDSLMWMGEDARGQRACWRDQAFQPQRVSNFAVEWKWSTYHKISDAVAFPFIWQGHLFYQITFPSAYINTGTGALTAATWVYDATVSTLLGRPVWHERQYLDAQNNLVGRPELFHCFCYGKHLVGSGGADGNPGAIYQYSATQYSDCGMDNTGAQVQRAMVRDRIAPHGWSLNKRVIYNRLELELARGVGLSGAPPVGVNPNILLRWSNDGGETYGNEIALPMGAIGQYAIRVLVNRLGYARDRVFWIRCSDPVYASILGAELDIIPLAA